MTANLVQGAIFTVMTVRVTDPSDPLFEPTLAEQVARNPRFFANAPVVLDLRDAPACNTADDFHALRRILKRHHLVVAGVQNANSTQSRAAMNADLATFSPSNGTAGARPLRPAPEPQATPMPEPPAPQAAAPVPSPVPGASMRSRLILQPVRSGTQIYAKGADLIVLASVSPGAELIADGNIHVYGTLRGRAIAGASGDAEARIFTNRLEAELVCVAGRYLVNEAIGKELLNHPVQVALVEDRLTILKN
jgi:septum site-determining protein MinC